METIESLETVYPPLETGDVLLYHENQYLFARVISYFTGSEYTHCSMVIRDPQFTTPPLKGLYILESGLETIPDAENHRPKFGVQLVPFEEVVKKYNGRIYVRRLKCIRNDQFYGQLGVAHSNVHNENYDVNILDMLRAIYDDRYGELPAGSASTQKQTWFWCSALIAYIFVTLGFLPQDTPWTLVLPKHFGTEKDAIHLKFQNCELGPETLIHKK